jgi:hypothetical protein
MAGHSGLQSLTATLMASELVPGRTTAGCMLLYKQAVLHTTLPASDSAALYLLASNTVIPTTRAVNKTTRTLQKLYSSVADWSKRTNSLFNTAMWHVSSAKGDEGLLTHGAASASQLGACPLMFVRREQACRLIVWQTSGFLVRSLQR